MNQYCFEKICLFYDMQIFYEHLLIKLELCFNMKTKKLELHVQKKMLENYILLNVYNKIFQEVENLF
jgi:hypothetical protein